MSDVPALRVIDGFIPEHLIDAALASVLPPESEHWRRGSLSAGPDRVGRDGPTFLGLPDDHPTVSFIEAAIVNTDASGFIRPKADHSYCGLFQMLAGAELSPHRDHNTCRNRAYRRRLGIILFLNDPDGGEFELWDEVGVTDYVEPLRGRLILFDVNLYHAVRTVESRRLTFGIHLASQVVEADPPAHARMTWLADDHPGALATATT